MNRNDAIDHARDCALAHAQDHAYLPTSEAEAAEWLPHAWVVDAIVSAAAGREQFARIAETINIRPYETALEISRRIAERIRAIGL